MFENWEPYLSFQDDHLYSDHACAVLTRSGKWKPEACDAELPQLCRVGKNTENNISNSEANVSEF